MTELERLHVDKAQWNEAGDLFALDVTLQIAARGKQWTAEKAP